MGGGSTEVVCCLYVYLISMPFTGTVLSSQKELTTGPFSNSHVVNTSATCDLDKLKTKLSSLWTGFSSPVKLC